MTPFQTREITDEKEYFGRDHIIANLTSFANMGLNKEIIGLRRSGKTSLLKIMEQKLRQDIKSTVYPVFFDFKETDAYFGKGTHFVYKYMISRLVAGLYEDGILKDSYTLRGITIEPSSLFEDIYECLKEITTTKATAVFSELIELCVQKTNKSVLFLIDEYEYLFTKRFDSPDGFVTMRKLGSKLTSDGRKPFSFWIAGAMDWDKLCTFTGSGQLNVIDSPTIFLSLLDRESFHKMWEHEISFCESEGKRRFLSEKEEMAFVLSGGFPHFGKQIGLHFMTSETDPAGSFFDSHFKEIERILDASEKECLYDLARESKDFNNTNVPDRLINTGLVKKQGSHYEINIPLYKKFLVTEEKMKDKKPLSKAHHLANLAEKLIIEINNNCKNYKKDFIFKMDNETLELWQNIRTPCQSHESLEKFASSMYKLIYETTKGINPQTKNEQAMQRLPSTFRYRYEQFIEIVGLLRHTIGKAHLATNIRSNKNKLSYPKMLEVLTGSKSEPHKKEDFEKIQIGVLTQFESAIRDLLQIVRDELKAGKM
jgi:hypothetical protein